MKNRISVVWLFLYAGIQLYGQSENTPVFGKDPVDDIISSMTLEEKAFFVTGTGVIMPGLSQTFAHVITPGAPVVGKTKKMIPGIAGTTYEISRLGIPGSIFADGPAGLRIDPIRKNDTASNYCTAFPIATLLASTWDTDLVYKVGQSIGNEVLEYGVDILLGPALNIHRNPLCGRNFEYYSEDPLITGKMAAAMVNGIESNGVGASVKHFAANNTETNRNALNTVVSERALREIYLKGFGIAIDEAQPWTVMSSYNLINGIYAPENVDLITKVLRNDWGFKGFVMTDWFGGKDPVAMMIAGNDILMPGRPRQARTIIRAVKKGKLDEEILDRNVSRILNILLLTPKFKGYEHSNRPPLEAHAVIARKAASEGMVLLKNDKNALPFSQIVKEIAVFGNTSYNIITGGTGSGDVNEAYSISLTDGLKGAGYFVNEELQTIYTAYIKKAKKKQPRQRVFMPVVPFSEMELEADQVRKMAVENDVAIITIGRSSGEFVDRKEEEDFNLSGSEKDMIKTVSDAFHAEGKKVVVILNVGGVIETASWCDNADAILLAWQGGQDTGHSIADVVSGKVNPSGKLATTFPLSYDDVPSAKNFPGVVIKTNKKPTNEGVMMAFLRPKPSKIIYEEGIYVGYRYFNTFHVPVAYEFGYGLSYTDFEYSGLEINAKNIKNSIIVTLSIKNTGKVAGREVVQLYLSAPANNLDKPSEELKGFVKTKLLKPGDSQMLTFELSEMDLASFDPRFSAWITEAGTYKVKIGTSSRDIRLTDNFILPDEISVRKESTALVPAEEIHELKP
ncbi:MAG: glycoside hydrolase family 3 C-terminal domain-containing protein [Bacteroidales bacterium]|nr:glycoside hydrolase family 3 C-terminal domain-containing protein [Bacteroidales bacterium]MBN2762805.1 glycoside hydrolase family 3 C-terminal domain-containing protein [Bacteroidales bacterium]